MSGAQRSQDDPCLRAGAPPTVLQHPIRPTPHLVSPPAGSPTRRRSGPHISAVLSAAYARRASMRRSAGRGKVVVEHGQEQRAEDHERQGRVRGREGPGRPQGDGGREVGRRIRPLSEAQQQEAVAAASRITEGVAPATPSLWTRPILPHPAVSPTHYAPRTRSVTASSHRSRASRRASAPSPRRPRSRRGGPTSR